MSKGEETKPLDETELEEETMAKGKKKRIRNPKTRRYYRIRQRSSTKGKRGTIMGKWKPTKKKR